MSYGKSLNLSQNTFPAPPEPEVDAPESEYSYRQTRRTTNVYDAVAGRVNRKGHHPSEAFASRYRDTASSGARTLRPEEVLFRTQNTVTDPLEEENYFANENIRPDNALPSSEILEAIHAYAADFYEFATEDHGLHDHHSMDETALIAMGILVEEMAREALGETGDLVLVEGEELPNGADETGAETDTTNASQSRDRARRRKRAHTGGSSMVSSQDNLKGVRQKFKRRKLKRGASTTDADTELDER
ncbi:uncharacterized protein N7496_000819 [Penicillium cataractarum]|uniref:Uncharacterized protein n=1 Tax=Penicillium cataractarum TaxID=2100454 RepID=A0A9X0B6D3_9EURO|nr:uncharacterized protein N7496_000819 [Penicillium cataractarum]KAJ5389751.1 hypothetical protein N7496_000819 [Penicillium cataractarum]